jgi:hypothetical protein
MAGNLHRSQLDNSSHIWRVLQGAEVKKIQYWRKQHNVKEGLV